MAEMIVNVEAFDAGELAELAASMAAHGLAQPITVRPWRFGYQIVAGERRWRAACRLHWHTNPSGDPAPSPEDVALTRRLVEAAQLVEVEVLDHLIIGHGRWVSLRERGMGFESAQH